MSLSVPCGWLPMMGLRSDANVPNGPAKHMQSLCCLNARLTSTARQGAKGGGGVYSWEASPDSSSVTTPAAHQQPRRASIDGLIRVLIDGAYLSGLVSTGLTKRHVTRVEAGELDPVS
ncbi:unnamed protein product [Lota lota]